MESGAIADGLRELARLLEALGEPLFRARAHERAARALRAADRAPAAARV